MRYSMITMVGLVVVASSQAADLAQLPPNTWVDIPYATRQPSSNPDEKGYLGPAGWNKLVYDPDGKRVLFYDRWVDKKHGGQTIYGNCLFALDPAAGTLTPVKIDHWTKIEPAGGGYRTVALPENDREPTPAPRHVYHAFEYVPALKGMFLCNGANQTVIDKNGKLVGHDACDGVWRLDLGTNKWSRIDAGPLPRNLLDDAMAYCPETKSIVYLNHNRQIWLLDLGTGQFRKAKESPPARNASGGTIFYDPTQRRMLIAGGGPLEGPYNQAKAPGFRELFAFDPRTETVTRLADCPVPLYAAHLAFDSKHQRFVMAATFWKNDHPSGMFAYDPARDAWQEIKPANPVPAANGWFSWLKLCYDSHHDCFVGMIGAKFYAYRHVPPK